MCVGKWGGGGAQGAEYVRGRTREALARLKLRLLLLWSLGFICVCV